MSRNDLPPPEVVAVAIVLSVCTGIALEKLFAGLFSGASLFRAIVSMGAFRG